MDNNYLLDTKALTGKLQDYQPLEIKIVNNSGTEALWNHMVSKYHYLGGSTMIGPRIKYLVFYQNRPIAALSYNRASLKIGVRDAFIGWDKDQKRHCLKYVVNNNRFLILPWVKIRYLASHLLSQTLKMLKKDWPERFSMEPYLVETFVDASKYAGTCYKAANWIYLGETKGFGKSGQGFIYHGQRKKVFIYTLNKRKLKNAILSAPTQPPLRSKRKRVPNMMFNIPDWSSDILLQAGIIEEEIEKLGVLLDNYLDHYQQAYSHKGQQKNGETFVKGLLSNLERKSVEPIALEYSGTKGVRPLQIFFKSGKVDDSLLLDLYQQRLASNIASSEGMINVDASDFLKKGKHSVGVSRQYCGSLGKVENCQSGVFVGYSSEIGYGLVDVALYMPEVWFSDEHAELRNECAVPENLKFKTKVELASELITKTVESGHFPARWIGCDSFFGRNKKFLLSLPKQCYYFADIPENTLVYSEMPELIIPDYSGRGKRPTKPKAVTKPITASELAKDNNNWRQKVLAEGAKGPIVSDIKCLRVVEANKVGRHYLPGQEVWLYMRRYSDGKVKYALCNAPAQISISEIEKASMMRWPIEQCFEECKTHLGMDHIETRSWKAWHRHMLYVFIAHLFVTELRLRFKKNTNSDNAAG